MAGARDTKGCMERAGNRAGVVVVVVGVGAVKLGTFHRLVY
jgi:hypothetical protein